MHFYIYLLLVNKFTKVVIGVCGGGNFYREKNKQVMTSGDFLNRSFFLNIAYLYNYLFLMNKRTKLY